MNRNKSRIIDLDRKGSKLSVKLRIRYVYYRFKIDEFGGNGKIKDFDI